MLPSDLALARLCAASEKNPVGFDYIDEGKDTGVWWGLVKQQDHDLVCFRGSITIEDWWRDGHAEMIALPNIGLVHAGFAQGMQEAKTRILGMTRPDLVITGHSLGAARAAIFAGMMGVGVAKVALFGCPRPGAQQLVDILKDIPITSYKNRHDPVTDVPLPMAPEFPYAHVRLFTSVDGVVDYSLGPPWDDHHIVNYVKGIENAQSNPSG